MRFIFKLMKFQIFSPGFFALAIAAMGTGSLDASVVLIEDFESNDGSPGQFNQQFTGLGFEYPLNAEGGAIPTHSVFFSDRGLVDSSELKNFVNLFDVPDNSLFQVDFDFYEPTGVGVDGARDTLRLRIGSAEDNIDTLLDFGLGNGAFFTFSDTTATQIGGMFAPDTLIHVTLVINNTNTNQLYGEGTQSIAAQSYDVLVNDSVLAEDVLFRNAISDPDGMGFFSFQSTENQAYVDNVSVRDDVIASVPEPSSLILLGSGMLVLSMRRKR